MNTILSNFKNIFVYDPANPMLFNSGTFFLLFVVFIITYAIIHRNKVSVTIFVTLFSFFFYYKSSGLFISILVFTSITDYSFALGVDRAKKKAWKKLWLFLAVTSSLAILAFFKYTNFFLENTLYIARLLGDFPSFVAFVEGINVPVFKSFSEIISSNFQPLDIFLPIGISFYTFQSISYVIDVYQKKIPPTESFLDYAFFLSFFPQLVAGPIVKANLFLPQLRKKITISKEAVWGGLWLIIIGLFKKAVIADYISQYNDFVFGAPHTYSGFENLMAVLGYALQIYGDFSGYSDMAIGLAMLMGFDLGINFNFPYKSQNITEFWRRWHISLSSWLRDYLYISLGGNRKGKFKMYRNLFITMFLGGLWHGANWKFVIWGSMHGMALAIHKALGGFLEKIPNRFPSKFISWFVTFVFVITLWIFFRATDIPENQVSKLVKNASDYEYYSKTIGETDSTKTVKVIFTENDIKKDSLIAVIPYEKASKVRVFEKIKGKDKEITIKVMISAYETALLMISQVLFDTDFIKYTIPFWEAHQTWVILMLIGFLMHASPTNWTNKVRELFIKSPYIVKLLLFLIILQLAIQFKSEDVVPFIYFQF